jgi:hypothetical protein
MGVGIAFLRPRPDGTWEGDYTLVGWGTFGKFQDLLLSLPGLLYFLSHREGEYGVELGEGPPPYPAWVTPELAKDLEDWRERVGPFLLAALRQVPMDEIGEYLYSFKTMIEEQLAQGYAIVVSY